MPTISAESMARRPSLAERRKTQTRFEIAKTAAKLFAEHGTADVTADQIAAAAGIGLRTFYRYCRTKEDAIEPMLSAGAERWLADIESGPRRLPTLEELEAAAVRALTPDTDTEDLRITRGLLQAMADDQALRSVWHRINLDGEDALYRTLTGLAGADADPLRLRLIAGATAGAIRIALEQWAATNGPTSGPGSAADLVVRCIRELTAGLRD